MRIGVVGRAGGAEEGRLVGGLVRGAPSSRILAQRAPPPKGEGRRIREAKPLEGRDASRRLRLNAPRSSAPNGGGRAGETGVGKVEGGQLSSGGDFAMWAGGGAWRAKRGWGEMRLGAAGRGWCEGGERVR